MRDPRGIVGIPAQRRPARRTAPVLAGALLAAAPILAAKPAVAGQLRELAREATPLVLKDGRIAHVAIYAVPFRPGANDLDPEVKAELAGLVETLATDCFLTAQAIGHVEPEAAKAGDTLTAHRLARARADRIQQAMVERGLQASAIASVWDWQFLVKEPRVTVWVFRLHEGEDCQGKRLERPTAATGASPPGARELPVRSNLASTGTSERPAAERLAQGTPAVAAARPAPAGTPPPGSAETAARGEATAPMPGSTPPPRPMIAARQPQPRQPAPSLPGASAAAEEVLVSPLEAAEETSVAQPQPGSSPAAVSRAAASPPAGSGSVPAQPSPSQPGPLPTAAAQPTPTHAAAVQTAPTQTVPAQTTADPRGGSARAPAPPATTAGAAPASSRRATAEPPAGDSAPAKPPVAASAPPTEATSAGTSETGARTPTAEAGAGAGPAEAPAAARLAAIDPGVVRGPAGLEIVFEVNSSYLPKGAAAELRRFVKDLPAGGTIRLEIVGAVGGADVKEAGGSSGLRYNRWLAERRIARVADWLKENAGGRRLEIRTGFADDDPSRRVTVRLEAGG